MQKIQPIISHLERVYGLEVVPCSIPRNNFQVLKRNFYLYIKQRISEDLFYLIDRVSPIKFLKDRPEGEIWLRKRNSEGRIEFEIELKPLPIEACIYYFGSKDPLLDINKGDNYKVRVYHLMSEIDTIEFVINHHNGCQIFDNNLSVLPIFKQLYRDYKLTKLGIH